MKIVYRRPAPISDPTQRLTLSTDVYIADEATAASIRWYANRNRVSYLDAAIHFHRINDLPITALQILDVVDIEACRASGCTNCSKDCPYYRHGDNPMTNYQFIHSLPNERLTAFLRNVHMNLGSAHNLIFPDDDWLESTYDATDAVWNGAHA